MKKQQFKTVDMVIVITVLVALGGVGIGIVRHNHTPDPTSRVQRMAENISSQLLNLDRKKFHSSLANASSGERDPSSDAQKSRSVRLGPEGIIGEDPWGQPFEYRFVEDSKGHWTHLIVWSRGPDTVASKAVSDWTHESLVTQNYTKHRREVRMGDDFGLIYSLNN